MSKYSFKLNYYGGGFDKLHFLASTSIYTRFEIEIFYSLINFPSFYVMVNQFGPFEFLNRHIYAIASK